MEINKVETILVHPDEELVNPDFATSDPSTGSTIWSWDLPSNCRFANEVYAGGDKFPFCCTALRYSIRKFPAHLNQTLVTQPQRVLHFGAPLKAMDTKVANPTSVRTFGVPPGSSYSTCKRTYTRLRLFSPVEAADWRLNRQLQPTEHL